MENVSIYIESTALLKTKVFINYLETWIFPQKPQSFYQERG